MYLLVVDTETTGLPEDEHETVMIEFACALYSVERKTTLWQFGTILDTSENGLKENPCENINGILMEDIYDSQDPSSVHEVLFQILLLGGPDPVAVVAHNAGFDKHYTEKAEFVFPWPWLDSVELEYPNQRGSKRLAHLCADHGIFGQQTHRALGDVMMLCDLLSKVDSLKDQVEEALMPQGLWKAGVSYHTKDLAKERGFRFRPGTKDWVRKWPIEKPWPEDLPFRVKLIEKM